MDKIVVIGSLNMDLVIESPRFPAAGETILGRGFLTNPGGKGANQAVAAAKLGSKVSMIGCVGKDSFGNELISSLKKNEIDTTGVNIISSRPTGVAVIVVSKNDNMIIVNPGANLGVTKNLIKKFDDIISESALLMVQLEIPLDTVEWIINFAGNKKIPILLNPAPAVKLPYDLYKKVDYLIPNESEAEILCGKTITTVDDAKDAVSILHQKGVKHAIITLGSKGAVFNKGNTIVHVPAEKVEAVDTTAAGDAFSGALGSALIRKMDIDEAVSFAIRASALAVTRFGAQASLPTEEEVEQLIEKNY